MSVMALSTGANWGTSALTFLFTNFTIFGIIFYHKVLVQPVSFGLTEIAIIAETTVFPFLFKIKTPKASPNPNPAPAGSCTCHI